jgi:hypothetical protein
MFLTVVNPFQSIRITVISYLENLLEFRRLHDTDPGK